MDKNLRFNNSYFTMDFSSTHVLVWRERITTQITQLAGLSIVGHIITHSVETRPNTR
jgi:hypothetical protein